MKVHTYKGKGQSIYLGLVRNLDLFLLLFNSENEDRAHFSQEATLGKIHFRFFIVLLLRRPDFIPACYCFDS